MTTTGAPSPRRAGLIRLAEATARGGATTRLGTATTRLGTAVRDHRSRTRELREARRFFHDELRLAAGASVPEVLEAISTLRGRRVESLLLPGLPPDVSGIAVPGENVDYIGLSDRLSRRHHAHVLLHEVRHLRPSSGGDAEAVAAHQHFDGVSLQALRDQMSALPARVREEILTRPAKLRSTYDDPEERACEWFARVALPLLDLNRDGRSVGSLTTAFSNRRSI
ncbi:hypothetical protein ACIOJD_23345 [Streptomyces sp. NPDC088116]|uniref:hypothetical protein n=1 Tax=Streptomyces sp. NPDC088116 TaxID=3365825 RepID=UPI003828AECE